MILLEMEEKKGIMDRELIFQTAEEISRGFMETPAYEVLFEKLVTDAGAASEFVNRVMRANGNKQAAPIASN